ncbi:RICIN domain-containing protein [Bacillus mycoides]|uniref:RICIN domain-containing protein n=1 Tax=Bacillus TaxID=1386 RepID=UPI001914C5C3|nr:RICIN domain-containing protein [Bacillus sp. TH25]MBK5431496.1 RICIN domain-containing protein [Bacillus sp. TH25]
MSFKKNTFYKLVNQNSGLLESVASNSLDDNAELTQFHESGNTSQHFILYLLDNNDHVLINRNSGRVQSVASNSLDDNAELTQYHWNGNTSQQWHFNVIDNNVFSIINSNSGKVQSVSSTSLDDNAELTQYHDNGHSSQQWQVNEVEGAEFTLPSVQIESLPEVPQYENSNDNLSDTTPVITSSTLIPCIMINDTWSVSDKVKNTPYYILYKKQYWKNIDSHTFAPNTSYTSDTTYGMTTTDQTSMTDTTNISVTVDAGFSFNHISSSISKTVTNELQVSTSTTDTLMTTQENSETIENPNGYEVSWTKFALVNEYYLARADGTVIGDSPWVVINKNDERESYYPLDTPPLPVTLDESKTVN